jgi:malonyl-CoA O-methyltransferase
MNRPGGASGPAADEAPRSTLDSRTVRTRFQRAARHYDAAARVAKELAARLLEHLDPVRIEPNRVLDLGAGSGGLTAALSRRYRAARVLALDPAESMLGVARSKTWRLLTRQQFVCAEAESLPLAAECVELVASNAALPWCRDAGRVFAESFRVLKPGGLFMFSTLGPDTLCELRQAFSQVDDRLHVHGFPDMHDLGDALVHAGFVDVVMDAALLTAEYTEVGELMGELKRCGASNAIAGRARGLTGRAKLERLAQAYETRRDHGLLPATFEAVFAHAWKPVGNRVARGVPVAPPRP